MSTGRGIVVLVVCAGVAGCGGGKHAGTTTSTATTAASPAAQRAEVKRVWERFFAGATPAAEKEALLENGGAYAKVIEAQASSPLAKQSSATVTRVVLTGPATASVRYTINLSGKPVLPGQRGTAVEAGGAWRVSQASFCKLLSLQGSVPKACASAG